MEQQIACDCLPCRVGWSDNVQTIHNMWVDGQLTATQGVVLEGSIHPSMASLVMVAALETGF